MGVLKLIGILLIVAWLVLWLAVKTAVAAVHVLLILGLVALVVGFLKKKA